MLDNAHLVALCNEKLMPGLRDQVGKTSLYWKRAYGDKSAKDKYKASVELSKMLSYGDKPPTETDGKFTTVIPTEFHGEMQMAVKYRYLVGDVLLTDSDKISNQGDAIVDLVATRIKNSGTGIKKRAGEVIFTGNNATNPLQIDGLGVVIDDANTWAGINRTLNPWFAAKKIDSGARVWTRDEINLMHVNLTTGLEERPTLQITHQTLWLKAAETLMEMDKALSAHKGLAEVGIENFIMNGSMVIKDVYCPEGWWIHLNENVTNLYVEPTMDMKMEDFIPVSNQPHAQVSYIKFGYVLWCEEPRLNGIHKNLTLTA